MFRTSKPEALHPVLGSHALCYGALGLSAGGCTCPLCIYYTEGGVTQTWEKSVSSAKKGVLEVETPTGGYPQ